MSPDRPVDQHTEDPICTRTFAIIRWFTRTLIAAASKLRLASFDMNNPNMFALQKSQMLLFIRLREASQWG
jgi:hypothetical protein